MLLDPMGRTIVGNLGWVDRGSLWVWNTAQQDAELVKLSDAKYLSLRAGRQGYFVVVHHYDGSRVDLTVHAFDKPAQKIGRISLIDGRSETEGDLTAFSDVPAHHIAYISSAATTNSAFSLVRVSPEGTLQTRPFQWYTDERYDKGYQGITDVLEVPDKDWLVVSVQRSSTLIIEDKRGGKEISTLQLAGRHGNPALFWDERRRRVWASDYDCLLQIDPDTLTVVKNRQLQDAPNGTQQFIGDYTFDVSGDNCIVARPFSSDALILNAETLDEVARVHLGGQPLQAVALSNGTVIARDWKNGATRLGTA